MASEETFLHAIISGEDPNLDIVAVHGLNPANKESHAELTWTAGGTAGGKLWLRDFLPRRLPRARVLLFGYNSNVAFKTSTAGVWEQAENLLNLLDLRRKEATDRPIIFIAHSLGGLVVKRALVEAKLNDKYGAIRAATFGIAFFATPHQGGNHATLGDVAAKISRAVLSTPGNTFMDHLKKDSLFSDNLTNEFKHQYEDYSILSFYETRFFKSTGSLVVEKESAVLGLAGTRETSIALNADHSQICKFEEGSNVYRQVEDNLADLAESAVNNIEQRKPHLLNIGGRVSAVFLVPYTKNSGFIGRDALMSRLIQRLSSEVAERSRVALFGLGGVGKTQLAIKYAYWFHEMHPETSIFWIHASNVERFRHSFLELAQELEIPEAESPKVDILILVKHWLEKKDSGKWLMIIDNADDFDMFFVQKKNSDATQTARLADYIPDCSHGSVLLTTRDKKVAVRILKNSNPLSLINVWTMNQMEAAELVRQVLAGEEYSDENVQQLTESLEYLPPAITQAAAFILENCISIPIYLQRYLENKDDAIELLSHDFETSGRDGETENAVTTTWILSFKQIKEKHPYAADILSLMAFLDRHCVPEELLRKFRQPNSSMDFEMACGTLKAFSLIDENPITIAGKPHRAFSIHRMVQLVTRQWLLDHDESKCWADNALVAVSKVFPPGERENWDRCVKYLPQVETILKSKDGSSSATNHKADLLHNASSYYRVKGYHGRAEKMGLEAVALRRSALGDSHPDTILSLTSLSRVYLEQNRIDKAIELQRCAVASTQLALDEAGTDDALSIEHNAARLQATRHLAAIYGIQNRFQEAETLQLKVFDESKKLLGDEHLDTLLAMRDLAVTCGRQGRPDEAQILHEHVFAVRKRVLGDDHPESLISMSDLAVTLCQQDPFQNAAGAERLETYVVTARKSVLGSEHPKTLHAMRDLAMTYELQNRDDEADQLRREVLEVSQRGKEVLLSTFRDMSNEIVTYKQQSLEEVGRKAIEERKPIFGVKSPKELPEMEVLPMAENLSSQSKSSLLVPTSESKDLEDHNHKEEGRTRGSWRRRLLSFDHRRGKAENMES